MINLKAQKISELKASILSLQGYNSESNPELNSQLGVIASVFPNSTFPIGSLHEFLVDKKENETCTSGFIAGLLKALMGNNGCVLWVSAARTLFPPALRYFGLDPNRFLFIDLQNEKEVLWTLDESLKCDALSAVVGELKDIDFNISRRFQLCVERSKVTGFILRRHKQNLETSASASRWKITPLPSETFENLPGVGLPKWRVELIRVKNGKPAGWDIQWSTGRFLPIQNNLRLSMEPQLKAG